MAPLGYNPPTGLAIEIIYPKLIFNNPKSSILPGSVTDPLIELLHFPYNCLFLSCLNQWASRYGRTDVWTEPKNRNASLLNILFWREWQNGNFEFKIREIFPHDVIISLHGSIQAYGDK